MKLRVVWIIFCKELLDTVRDKRTLLAMVGVPVLLYPAMLIFATQAAMVQSRKLNESPSRVVVRFEEGPAEARESAQHIVAGWLRKIPKVDVRASSDPQGDLLSGQADAVVVVDREAEAALTEGQTVGVRIEYDSAESASRLAAHRLTEGLADEKKRLLQGRLDEIGVTEEYVNPLEIKRKDVAPKSKVVGTILGMILPLIMVLMVGVGAFYPAIDLTAGEKERGTFETLLSTPTSKSEIVTGKFLTVFCMATLAGVLNLGSMYLTSVVQLAQAPVFEEMGLQLQLSPLTIALMLAVLAVLAFLISAVMMSVAVFARNFKEAQNYLTPFFLLIIFPATLASLPGVKLSASTQFLPIANVALLFRQLMIGSVAPQAVFAVLMSTGVYAVAALVFASWVFQREEVVLAEERGIPLTFRRSSFEPRNHATFGMSMLIYATALVLVFHAGTYWQARDPLSGLIATQWILILGPPVAICGYARVRMREAFQFRLPRVGGGIGGLFVGIAWFVLVLQLTTWQARIFPMPPELQEEFANIFAGIRSRVGLWGLLAAAALSPAICEEILFRGAVLSGVRSKMPLWAGVVVVGVLFGVTHLSVHRLFTTTASGVVLTYLAWRSGSILPSMTAHFLLNGSVLLLEGAEMPGWVVRWIVEPVEAGGTLPWPVLAGAAALFFVGVVLVEGSARGGSAGLERAGRGRRGPD